METTIELFVFPLNKQFWDVGQNLPKKCFYGLKQKK